MHCRGFTILSAAAYLLVPIEKASMQPLALYDFVSIEQLMNLEVADKTEHHVIECDRDRVILSHVKMSLGYLGTKAEAF